VIGGFQVSTEEQSSIYPNPSDAVRNSNYHPAFKGISRAKFPSQPTVPSFQLLGVRVHAVQMSEAIERLRSWIDSQDGVNRYVAVTGMHGIAESRESEYFRSVLNDADLVVPDGMPLVWVGRLLGYGLRKRVCGSELMAHFCESTGSTYRHFFFGAAPGIAENLAKTLHEKYGIVVAGTYTPPFRPMTDSEMEDLASLVEERAPDVFWVGLSTPKQEKWMHANRNKINAPVMLGVGAAFDMNSGNLRRAPSWMGEIGLEWFFRLVTEPRRLWKRYLVTIPRAVWFVSLELLQSSRRRSVSDTKENKPGYKASGATSQS